MKQPSRIELCKTILNDCLEEIKKYNGKGLDILIAYLSEIYTLSHLFDFKEIFENTSQFILTELELDDPLKGAITNIQASHILSVEARRKLLLELPSEETIEEVYAALSKEKLWNRFIQMEPNYESLKNVKITNSEISSLSPTELHLSSVAYLILHEFQLAEELNNVSKFRLLDFDLIRIFELSRADRWDQAYKDYHNIKQNWEGTIPQLDMVFCRGFLGIDPWPIAYPFPDDY